jgi:hypothetical protein
VGALNLRDLKQMSRFRLADRQDCGQDAMEIWVPTA